IPCETGNFSGIFGRCDTPFTTLQILQWRCRIAIIHLEKANSGQLSVLKLLFITLYAFQVPFHIGLTTREPHIPNQYILDGFLVVPCTYSERIGVTGTQRRQLDLPVSVSVSLRFTGFRRQLDTDASIQSAPAPYGNF